MKCEIRTVRSRIVNSNFIAEGGSPGPDRNSSIAFEGCYCLELMPVYHFTLHAYRSWSPNNKHGYTERGKGYQPPNPSRANQYNYNAKQDRVAFDELIQQVLILGAHNICQTRRWRLHAVGSDPSHVHLVVSWTSFIPWKQVQEKLKNVLSLFLGRATQQPGRRWFVVGGSRKRVTDQEHLSYLLNTYLPDHVGVFWREGMELPEDTTGILDGR